MDAAVNVLFPSAYFRMAMERIHLGGPGFPMSAPMFATPDTTVTRMAAHRGPAHGMMMHRFAPPLGVPTFSFSQEEVDMVLYGYTKNKQGDKLNGHALSGLRLGDITHGKVFKLLSFGFSGGSRRISGGFRKPPHSRKWSLIRHN